MITSFLNGTKLNTGKDKRVDYSEESVALILNQFLVKIKANLKTGNSISRISGNIGKVMQRKEGDDLLGTNIKEAFSDNKITRLMDTFVDFDDRFTETQELLLEKNALKVLLSDKEKFRNFVSKIEPSLQKDFKLYNSKTLNLCKLCIL